MFDSRFASQCHEWIHKTYAPSRFNLPAEPSISVVQEIRARLGMEHELRVMASLRQQYGERFLELAGDDRQSETLDALKRTDILLIAGAEFGNQTELAVGRATTDRIGRPDLLLRMSDGWAPIDIKSHGSLNKSSKKHCWMVDLASVSDAAFNEDAKTPGRLKESDALQLAHYWAQLQELQLGSSSWLVGIIGRDGAQIVMQRIDATAYGNGHESALSLYKYGIAEALGIHELAKARELDPALPAPTTPRLDADCGQCEFRTSCLAEMKAWPGGGHPTLIPGLTPSMWRDDYAHLQAISDVAALVESQDLKERSLGIKARAWLDDRVYSLTPGETIEIPTFDIEIDVDLENSQAALFGEDATDDPMSDVVFQYGWVRNDRTVDVDWRDAETGVFENFANSLDAEYEVMSQMWAWCQKQVADAQAAGKSIGFFHYSPHEIGWWRKFVDRHASKPGVPTLEECEEFLDAYWHDLRKTTIKFAFHAKSYSIKDIGPLSGFKYEVEDPGGDMATVKFLAAVDSSNPAEQKDAQDWLTTYNRGDVQTTMWIRNWLRGIVALGELT